MLFESSKSDVGPAEVLLQVKALEPVYLCPFWNLPR